MVAQFLLPPSNILPHTYQYLSSIMKEIGMHYEGIHACLDDHVIYYNHHEFETECLECHISRYWTDQVTKKVHRKALHYILIILCLQRLFRCKNIAHFMDYHAWKRIQDYIIQMLVEGSTFRDIEEKSHHFKEEPFNIRISLVEYCVNPFVEMRSVYLVWPIFVINNNIPPWLSIKREHIMLLMIIPGILCLQLFIFNVVVASQLSYFVS